MLQKLEEVEFRFVEIERKLSDPEVISDQKKYQDLLKQHSAISLGLIFIVNLRALPLK